MSTNDAEIAAMEADEEVERCRACLELESILDRARELQSPKAPPNIFLLPDSEVFVRILAEEQFKLLDHTSTMH